MSPEITTAMQGKDSGVAKRRPLRLMLSVSAVTGLIFNIITIAVNAKLNWRPPIILDGWAFLPLVGSLLWSHLDMHLGNKTLERKPLAFLPIVIVDAVGFLGFLALLIANGIVTANLRDEIWRNETKIILHAYNSFPWMVSATLHLLIVLMTLVNHASLSFPRSWRRHRVVCPNCHKTWKTKERESMEAEERSLLGNTEYHDENVEEGERSGRQPIRLEGDA